jgi:multidrug efflux system membrane fusion protein
MLMVDKIDPIYADFTVTEADLGQVQHYVTLAHEAKQDLQVIVTIPTAAAMVRQALSATTAPATQQTTTMTDTRAGKLEFLDNSVQDGTGTVKLRASLPNTDYHFWPGQYVNVRLILTIDKNAVLIPNEAIQTSQTGPFVFIINHDGTADMRNVTLGQKQGAMVVISSGLKAGDTVVTQGQLQLAPGAKVNIVGGGNAPTTQSVSISWKSRAVPGPKVSTKMPSDECRMQIALRASGFHSALCNHHSAFAFSGVRA